MVQIHKKFTDSQVKDLIERYLDKKIERKYIQKILGIKKKRFFAIVKRSKDDPENFSISYSLRVFTRKILKDIEINILTELKIERDLIKNKDILIKWYNYSYTGDFLEENTFKRLIDMLKGTFFTF